MDAKCKVCSYINMCGIINYVHHEYNGIRSNFLIYELFTNKIIAFCACLCVHGYFFGQLQSWFIILYVAMDC